MIKTDEKIIISVDEEPDTEEDGDILDLDYSLNILDGNQASLVTELINARLEAGILSTSDKVHIKISFAEVPEIVIYENVEFDGTYYLPFRISPVSHSGKVFNYGQQQFLLNNRLRIEVFGKTNTLVNVTMRVTEWSRQL